MKTLKFLATIVVTVFLYFEGNAQTWNIPSTTGGGTLTSYIGTTNANDMIFKTNSTEYMRLVGVATNTGFLGIGTTTPKNKLDVNGGMALGSYAGVSTASTGGLLMSGNLSMGTTQSTYSLNMYHKSTDPLGHFDSRGVWIKMENVAPNTDYYTLALADIRPAADQSLIRANYFNGTSTLNMFSVYPDGSTTIGNTSSTGTMLSIPAGNIIVGGVSSTPSGYRLFVKDGILTEKVKVATSGTIDWSDFVFDKNYKLKPLNEVEAFINKNHHLPEIPSTEEVNKNGVDLLEMDAKLLQKIEELTLYMIDMKKENEQLKTKVANLENQISK